MKTTSPKKTKSGLKTKHQSTSKPKKIDCCWNTIEDAKHTARATWICPVCEKDVSLLYVLFSQAAKRVKSTHKEIITK